MAQKTQIILVDDIDGSEAIQTVTFALDGVSYEIDLNNAYERYLAREALGSWAEAYIERLLDEIDSLIAIIRDQVRDA